MARKFQFLVIGSRTIEGNPVAEKTAFEVGSEIARRGHVLITGGLSGVMECASKGAHSNKGIVVGIIPSTEKNHANAFCDIVIASGIGLARNYINCYSSDAVIIISGHVGTQIEALVSSDLKLPIACFPETKNFAKECAEKDLLKNGHKIKAFYEVKKCIDFLEKEILKKEKTKFKK